MATKVKKDVPKSKVGEIVQSYIDNDGATKVAAERQPTGTKWTITATVP